MRGAKIGNYTTISFDKLLRIGCHNISKEEVQYIDDHLRYLNDIKQLTPLT